MTKPNPTLPDEPILRPPPQPQLQPPKSLPGSQPHHDRNENSSKKYLEKRADGVIHEPLRKPAQAVVATHDERFDTCCETPANADSTIPSLNSRSEKRQRCEDRHDVEIFSEKQISEPVTPIDSGSGRTSRASYEYSHSRLGDGDDNDRISDIPYRYKSSFVWRTLCYLTFLNPLLCFVNFIYTLLILMFVAILFPFKYLSSSSKMAGVRPYLVPQLCLHLRFLHPSPDTTILLESFHDLRLVIVHLLAPFLAIPLGVSAGCVAFVWFYTEVLLGDKNEAKGMEFKCFLALKHFWEEYVLSSLKPKVLSIGP